MTGVATYVPGAGDRDKVRLLIRDTGPSWVYDDAELDVFLTLTGDNAVQAAIFALRNKTPQLAALASWSRSIGSVSLSSSDGGASFIERYAAWLETWATKWSSVPVNFRWKDPDRIFEPQRLFAIGMHDPDGMHGSMAQEGRYDPDTMRP